MKKEEKEKYEREIRKKYDVMKVNLTEKGKRVWAGLEVNMLPYGGKGVVSRATGLDYNTINRGLHEIEIGDTVDQGRKAGGGRKKNNRTG